MVLIKDVQEYNMNLTCSYIINELPDYIEYSAIAITKSLYF